MIAAAAAVIVLVVLGGIALAAGTIRWSRTSAGARTRLVEVNDRGTERNIPGTVSPEELAALPEPVQRYFAFALAPRQRTILRAHLRQGGTMRSDAGATWAAFTAIETFSTQPVGFVWDASAVMMPLLRLRIRDAYVAGSGASEASLAGLIPVQKLAATPEVTSSSLLRYLAEAAWLPTALLPQAGIAWTAIDRDHARATLTDSGTTVSIEVEFGDGGEIVRVSAMRYRDVRGIPVLTRWTGRFSEYTRRHGMMIPTSAEVQWSPPEGPVSVWRARLAGADYEFHP